MVKLEQYYETDKTVLAIVADRAKLRQKYGVNEVTDELLNQELTIKVNVGMGATDPLTKLQKFMQGIMGGAQVMQAQIPGLNMDEIWKEIFGHLGYQDGSRFFGQDAEKAQMMQQMQQMSQQMQAMQQELQSKQAETQAKVQIADQGNRTKIVLEDMKQEHDRKMMVGGAVKDHMMQVSGHEMERANGAGRE